MNLVRHATWPLFAACLVGCATPPAELVSDVAVPVAQVRDGTLEPIVLNVVVVAPSPDDYLCNEETVTGSHQEREVCKTRAQRAFERAQAQEWLRSGGYYGGGTSVSSAHSARRTTRSAR